MTVFVETFWGSTSASASNELAVATGTFFALTSRRGTVNLAGMKSSKVKAGVLSWTSAALTLVGQLMAM